MAAVLRLTGLVRSGLVRPRLGYSLLLLVTGLFCYGLTQAAPALLTQGTYVSHAGHVYVKGGGNAATLSVTVVAASATYPAGTTFFTFTSMTDDPLGPFSGQSVHFRGNDHGGIPQVYRYRLDFDQEVTLDSIVVEGAAWGFLNNDTISLLDELGNALITINAAPNSGLPPSNNFHRQVLHASGIIGRTFFLEEFNEDTTWRYRSNIEINLSVGIIGDRPVAVDDDATVESGSSVIISVLDNDQGLADTPIMVDILFGPNNGTAIAGADNRVTYTSNTGFSGDDSFQYTATDRDGDGSSATVTVIVSDPPAPPPPPPIHVDPGGGGGCTVGPTDGTIDPTLPILLLISLGYLLRRRFSET